MIDLLAAFALGFTAFPVGRAARTWINSRVRVTVTRVPRPVNFPATFPVPHDEW